MNSPTQSSLYPVLKDIRAYLKQLLALLNEEHSALENSNIEKLAEFATTKQLLVENLEDLETERKNILSQAGLDLTKTGVADFLSRDNTTSKNETNALWDDIAELSRTCEEQNNLNGIIIEGQRRRTEIALQILQGKSTESELYSKHGKSVNAKNKSTSVRA